MVFDVLDRAYDISTRALQNLCVLVHKLLACTLGATVSPLYEP